MNKPEFPTDRRKFGLLCLCSSAAASTRSPQRGISGFQAPDSLGRRAAKRRLNWLNVLQNADSPGICAASRGFTWPDVLHNADSRDWMRYITRIPSACVLHHADLPGRAFCTTQILPACVWLNPTLPGIRSHDAATFQAYRITPATLHGCRITRPLPARLSAA